MSGIAFAFGMALSWAIMGVVLRSIPFDLDAFLVTGLRALFGLFAIALLIVATRSLEQYRLLTTTKTLWLVASILAGGVLGDTLYLQSLRLLGMTRCFPLINSYPLFTVLFSALLLGEQVTWVMIGGALLVFVGISMVARPGANARGRTIGPTCSKEIIKGVLMALACAALYGAESILVSLGAQDIDSIVANSVRVPVVAVVLLLIAGQRGQWRQVRDLGRRTVWLLVLGGVLGWAVAGSFWVAAVRLAGPTRAAVVGSTAPLFAVPLSVVLLRERPTRPALLGTVLTVIGVMLVV